MTVILDAKVVALGTTLLASALLGCSRSEPPPIDFIPTAKTRDSRDPKAALESAKSTCQEEARQKGMGNITAILFRRSKTSEAAYVECMRRGGFEIE